MDLENNNEFEEIPEMKKTLEHQELLENGWLREIMEIEEGVTRERIHSMELPELLEVFDEISGEPLEDTQFWRLQTDLLSSCVACQEFAAKGLLHAELSEEAFMERAKRQGWYADGTPPAFDGKLLEDMGLVVEKQYDATLEDIEQVLESGGKAIGTVHSALLEDPELAGIPWLSANRMIQIIGIDRRDPETVRVIVNDACVADGAGAVYDWSVFEQAWRPGGCYLLSAYAPSIQKGAAK